MDQKHFDLRQGLFPADAAGATVFVGPQQAAAITALKKGLSATDSVVTVTGPVGVGKTTIVRRGLEAVSSNRVVATIGRMRLGTDEVLELLLSEFGVSHQPTGTIQRFATFKRILNEWADRQTRVFVVVEDPHRVGIDALIELEALTAADAGESAGANIILTGPPELNELIDTPALARLRQRTRLRHAVRPFTAPEVLGYLKHCMRAVGGNLDDIVTPGAIDLVYRYTEGIPRLINNLFDSVLEAAAEANLSRVTPQMVQKVAIVVYGLTPALELPAPASAAAAATERGAVSDAVGAPQPVSAPAPVADPEPTVVEEQVVAKMAPEPPRTTPSVTIRPAAAAAPRAPAEPAPIVPEPARPELVIPETLTPSREVAESAESTRPVRTLPEALQPPAPEPAARPAAAPAPDAPGEIDWSAADDTQNMKQLDVDALLGRQATLEPPAPPAAPVEPQPPEEAPGLPELSEDDLPELTDVLQAEDHNLPELTDALPAEDDELPVLSDSMRIDTDQEKAKIVPPAADAGEPEKKPGVPQTDIDALEAALSEARILSNEADNAVADKAAQPQAGAAEASVPELTLEQRLDETRRAAKQNLDKLAEELGKAQTLDDIDDAMAETLFGDEELNQIAAEVVANPPPEAANQAQAKTHVPEPVPAETRPSGKTGQFDMTISQRYRRRRSNRRPRRSKTRSTRKLRRRRSAYPDWTSPCRRRRHRTKLSRKRTRRCSAC